MAKIKYQLSIVYIMWLRQLKRHFRSKFRVFASVGQPLLFFVALGFGFGPIYSRAGGGDYMQFLAPGIVAMSIMFSAMFAGMEVINDKQFGFLKETLVAPVSRVIIMLGRTCGGASVSVIQGLLVFCISLFLGFRVESFFGLALAFVFMLLIALFFTVLGTALASMIDDMHAFPLIMNFLMMPMFFLSGALFPLENLPKSIILVTRFNPLSYGVDGLRYALISQGHFNIFLDFSILLVCIIIFLSVGAYLFRRIQV